MNDIWHLVEVSCLIDGWIRIPLSGRFVQFIDLNFSFEWTLTEREQENAEFSCLQPLYGILTDWRILFVQKEKEWNAFMHHQWEGNLKMVLLISNSLVCVWLGCFAPPPTKTLFAKWSTSVHSFTLEILTIQGNVWLRLRSHMIEVHNIQFDRTIQTHRYQLLKIKELLKCSTWTIISTNKRDTLKQYSTVVG